MLGLRIEERQSPSLWMRAMTPVIAVLLTFFVTTLLLVGVQADPVVAYQAFLHGAFGSIGGITESLVKATPLMLVGLGISIAFRCRVWNIGGEGQVVFGAIIATLVGMTFEMSAIVLLLAIICLSFLIGAMWGALAGVLKAKFEVNEVIITIMMNYIAIYVLNYLIRGPMSIGGGWPRSSIITSSAWLPKLIPGTRLHAGFLFALLFAVLTYVLLFKTPLGYRIRAVGANPKSARYGGMSISKNIVLAMFFSGGLAGLAGMGEVTGLHHYLLDGISAGYGYTGIVVALLGKLHPLGVIISSILFGALIVGTQAMLRAVGITLDLVLAIEGMTVIFVLVSEVLTHYRLKRT
jgi:simple sugar transport system permease protein